MKIPTGLKELFQCISFRKKCQSANEYFKTQARPKEDIDDNNIWIEEEKLVEDDFLSYESLVEVEDDGIEEVKVVSEDEYIIEKIDECDESFIKSTVEPEIGVINSRKSKPNNRRKVNSQCRFCGIILSRRSRRIQHERLHMLDATQEFYKCYHCDKAFNQKTGLIPHFRSCHGFVQ